MRCRHIGFVLAGALASAALALPAQATPVSFDVTAVSLAAGSGYGVDSNETSGTLLNVQFSTSAFSTQNFSLDTPTPDSSTFQIGTVNFLEPDAHSGILAGETDNLGVTVTFTFTSPVGTTQLVTATGTATTGSVSDSQVDYTLAWNSIVVPFGSGGSFSLSLGNLSFTGDGLQKLYATITLLTNVDQQQAVPEPGTLALLGGGLIGIMVLRRRSKPTQA